MFNRILTVAETGWIELIRRKVLYVLIASVVFGFLGPAYVQHKWLAGAANPYQSDLALQGILFDLNKFLFFIGLCVSVLFGAGSVESEVSKRTLCSVMIRPIHRWEYLAGRTLSVIVLLALFSLSGVVSSYVAATLWGSTLPAAFLFGILQRLCRGIAWTMIALALGSITSSASAVTMIVVIGVLSLINPHISNDVHWFILMLKKVFYYATPSTWPVDFLTGTTLRATHSPLWSDFEPLLENLMYGAAVFLGCSWIFTKRDLKLRE